jgi:hypothetical protein
MKRAANISDALTTDLTTVATNDDRDTILATWGLLQTREVRLARVATWASNSTKLRDALTLEEQHNELEESLPRKLADLASEHATRRLAISLDCGKRLGLETDELGAKHPVGQRDSRACETEPRAQPRSVTTEVVGTRRRRDLRLDECWVTRELVPSNRRVTERSHRHRASVAIERRQQVDHDLGDVAAHGLFALDQLRRTLVTTLAACAITTLLTIAALLTLSAICALTAITAVVAITTLLSLSAVFATTGDRGSDRCALGICRSLALLRGRRPNLDAILAKRGRHRVRGQPVARRIDHRDAGFSATTTTTTTTPASPCFGLCAENRLVVIFFFGEHVERVRGKTRAEKLVGLTRRRNRWRCDLGRPSVCVAIVVTIVALALSMM